MSASLVGSEMCIRDRPSTKHEHDGLEGVGSFAVLGVPGLKGGRALPLLMPPAPSDDSHLALQHLGGSKDGNPVDPAAVAVNPLLVLLP
eukprot:14779607-Alexandrium_andersonii.AAC.1